MHRSLKRLTTIARNGMGRTLNALDLATGHTSATKRPSFDVFRTLASQTSTSLTKFEDKANKTSIDSILEILPDKKTMLCLSYQKL